MKKYAIATFIGGRTWELLAVENWIIPPKDKFGWYDNKTLVTLGFEDQYKALEYIVNLASLKSLEISRIETL